MNIDVEQIPTKLLKLVVLPSMVAVVLFFASRVPALEARVSNLEAQQAAASMSLSEMRKEQLELMRTLYLALGSIEQAAKANSKLIAIEAAERGHPAPLPTPMSPPLPTAPPATVPTPNPSPSGDTKENK